MPDKNGVKRQNPDQTPSIKDVKKLCFDKENDKSCCGSRATYLYRGKFCNVDVVIREIQWGNKAGSTSESERDLAALLSILKSPDLHRNVARYFHHEEDDQHYFYIATESCICSVSDLFTPQNNTSNWVDRNKINEVNKSLSSKKIIRQATKGVEFLHSLNLVHRNLKPTNFLIAKTNEGEYIIKVADFRTAKDLSNSAGHEHSGFRGQDGWIAPVPLNSEGVQKSQLAEDVFILGCFYYYVLTKGSHPFGKEIERTENICNPNYKVYRYSETQNPLDIKDRPQDIQAIPHNPDNESRNNPLDILKVSQEDIQAIPLMKKMIKYNPEDRSPVKTILRHAYFLSKNYYQLYDLPNVQPGLCVIYNQEVFKNGNNRVGTDRDKKALQEVFTDFGFDVRVHYNLQGKQLSKSIDDLAREDFSSYACLIVCILSHGFKGYVLGTDDATVDINELKTKFKHSDQFKSLYGKPKIWIIQACQNVKEEEILSVSKRAVTKKFLHLDNRTDCPSFKSPTVEDFVTHEDESQSEITDDESCLESTDDESCSEVTPKTESTENPTSQKTEIANIDTIASNSVPFERPLIACIEDLPRPPMSDFLDIRATIPGYYSVRNLMIQKLCNELRKKFLSHKQSKRHFEDVLKKVQKEIDPEIYFTKEHGQRKSIQQTIEWRSSLINFIRFESCAKQTIEDKNRIEYKSFYKLYQLKETKPGCCVIYSDNKKRKTKAAAQDGAELPLGEKDERSALRFIFRRFGFYLRQEANNIEQSIPKLAKQDLSSYASLVICVLSDLADKKQIEFIQALRNSKSLEGKPIIWITKGKCSGEEDFTNIPKDFFYIRIRDNPNCDGKKSISSLCDELQKEYLNQSRKNRHLEDFLSDQDEILQFSVGPNSKFFKFEPKEVLTNKVKANTTTGW